MPNVPVGVRRALARVRPDNHRPSDLATSLHRNSLSAARGLRGRIERMAPGRSEASLPVETDSPIVAPTGTHPRSRRSAGAHPASFVDHLGPIGRVRRGGLSASLEASRRRLAGAAGHVAGRERAIPLTVAGLVLLASLVSVVPAAGVPGSTDDIAATPRLVIGGGVLDTGGTFDAADAFDAALAGEQSASAVEDSGQHVLAAEFGQDERIPVGPYLADGTLLKPVAVDPTVPDAADRLQVYRVRPGDTLTGIAHKFGLSMMTIWWANKLGAKDELHVGQQLTIPPVDGLVVEVKSGETLDSIAGRTKVDRSVIADFNGLTDDTVVIGQTLIVPGALGAAIATPTPKPTKAPAARSRSSSSSSTRQPSSYSGGRFYFPVPGHHITQYYHYGHYAIDIDGSTGDPIHAAANGTVIYAGWKNNGGGYVVWLAHGSGLYTTYNHMSVVLVHSGQTVARGQVVGRMGATGWATGSHLHFEVWKGGAPLWPDRRVNPMKYF